MSVEASAMDHELFWISGSLYAWRAQSARDGAGAEDRRCGARRYLLLSKRLESFVTLIKGADFTSE